MKHPIRTLLAVPLFAFLVNLSTPTAHAQSDPDREQLKREIVEELIQELRDSGVLSEAVEEGIQEFIRQQQQARVDAQREQQERAERMVQDVRPVSADRDHIYGNPDAVVSLIEYSDYECPYCKRFHPTARELVDSSDGQVNWVYRHFPLAFHNPGAQKQAEATECARELGGNDGFWAYSDTIYERTASGGKGFALSDLLPLAEELGFDRDAFQECVESGRYETRVLEDFSEGSRIGITGTPGNVLLNNETGQALLRPGAQPLEVLQEAVESLLAQE